MTRVRLWRSANPHERRPRAPDYWEPEAAAEIAEPAVASDDAAGGDIAA
jgi:hypothetical protein